MNYAIQTIISHFCEKLKKMYAQKEIHYKKFGNKPSKPSKPSKAAFIWLKSIV